MQVMSSCGITAHTIWTSLLNPPRPVIIKAAEPAEPFTMVRLVAGLDGDGVMVKFWMTRERAFEVPGL